MQTFEATLDPVNWTEILQGNTYLAFDVIEAASAEVYLTETAATPSTSVTGSPVAPWPQSWDFQASGMEAVDQRIWARGGVMIRGVRG